MVKHSIEYNGISSLYYGATVDGSNTFKIPERDIERVEIEGRNGHLIKDNGRWKNIDIPFNLIFMDLKAMEQYLDDITLYCDDYYRLEDSYHPGVFRLATLKSAIEPVVAGVGLKRATLQLVFDCKPQRFLKDGEMPQSLWSINNPTKRVAKPLVRIQNPESSSQTIYFRNEAGSRVSIKIPAKSDITIDSELEEIYYTASMEDASSIVPLSGDFPTIYENGLVFEGTAKQKEALTIHITPRWWRL